eukprot:jgi/Mesvir1/20427/Mv25329-RA.1
MEERGVEAPAGQPIPEMDPRAGRTHKRWRDGQAEAEKVKRARRPTDAVVLTTPGEEDAIVTPAQQSPQLSTGGGSPDRVGSGSLDALLGGSAGSSGSKMQKVDVASSHAGPVQASSQEATASPVVEPTGAGPAPGSKRPLMADIVRSLMFNKHKDPKTPSPSWRARLSCNTLCSKGSCTPFLVGLEVQPLPVGG